MTIEVITPPDPAQPPISLALLKTHLNIISTETEYDDALNLYLASAVLEFTARTGTALINQTVKQTFDNFPCGDYFLLERAPYRSIVSFQYIDSNGDTQSLSSSFYTIQKTGDCPKVCLNPNYSWPGNLSSARYGGVQITYEVGFGATEAAIPKDIKHILALLVGDSFVNRENETVMPGIGAIIITNSSYNLLKKHRNHYYEVKGQRRC